MKKYYIILNGQNFLIDMNGKTKKHGFYQTFHLEAETPEQAEELAVQKISDNEKLKTGTLNKESDTPHIHLEEIAEIENFNGIDVLVSGKGWYPEKKWWEFWKQHNKIERSAPII